MILAACFLLSAAVLLAGGAEPVQKTLFRYDRKAGEVHRYRLSVRMSLEMRSIQMQNIPDRTPDKESDSWLEMEAEVSMRILESGPAGFTVRASARVIRTKMAGIFKEAEPGFKGFKIEDFTQRMDRRGRPKPSAKSEGQNVAEQIFDILLPATPVAIGETWRGTTPGSEYTYWGTTTWHGRPAREISALYSTKHSGWRLDGTSRLWVDPRNCTLLGVVGTMRFDTGDEGAMLVIAMRAVRIGS